MLKKSKTLKINKYLIFYQIKVYKNKTKIKIDFIQYLFFKIYKSFIKKEIQKKYIVYVNIQDT